MRVRITLTPLGQKIKYRIHGRIECRRLKKQPTFLANSGTYSKNDSVWSAIFASKLEKKKFLHKNRAIQKVVTLTDLGYSWCDSVRG